MVLINTVAQLIQQLDQARDKMLAALPGMEGRREIYPEWTIKEILAHITGWDVASVASLRAHVEGREAATPASRGIDAYNAEMVSVRQAHSFEQIVKEWEQTRESLKVVLQGMTDEKLIQTMVFPWGQRGEVAQIIAILAGHEEEHAEELRDFMAKGKHLSE